MGKINTFEEFEKLVNEKLTAAQEKLPAGLKAAIEKKQGKSPKKDEKETKRKKSEKKDTKKKEVDEKEVDKKETKGLTAKQKKLPKGLRDAILKKKKK